MQIAHSFNNLEHNVMIYSFDEEEEVEDEVAEEDDEDGEDAE